MVGKQFLHHLTFADYCAQTPTKNMRLQELELMDSEGQESIHSTETSLKKVFFLLIVKENTTTFSRTVKDKNAFSSPVNSYPHAITLTMGKGKSSFTYYSS